MDQHVWGSQDFTDENALALTGTIYSDAALSSAFDITGYTLNIRIKAQNKIIYEDVNDLTHVVSANGTFRYTPEEGHLVFEQNAEVLIELEKSGTRITAIGINGSADLHIMLV